MKVKEDKGFIQTSDIEKTVSTFDDLFKNQEGKPKKKRDFLGSILRLNIKAVIGDCFWYAIQYSPVIIKPLIVGEIITIAEKAVVGGGMQHSDWIKVLIYMAVLLVIVIQNLFSTKIRYSIASRMSRRSGAAVKCSVVRKLQSMSLNYQKDLETGKIQSKFIKDTETVDTYISTIMHQFIPGIVALLISIAVAVAKNGVVALFFLFVIPVNVALRNLFSKKIRTAYRSYRVSTEGMGSKMNTMIEMIPVTKSHGLEEYEVKNVENTIKDVADAGIKVDKVNATFGAVVWIINTILDSLCVLFCVVLYVFGKLGSIGDITVFHSLFGTITGLVSQLVNVLPQLASGKEALNSISEIMTVTDVELNIGKKKVKDVKGAVKFENVCYKYPKTDNYVVKKFNLDVKDGECIAVVGASGSGKSTLMNLIIGLMLPTEGTLSIDGNKITEFNLSEYRSHISVVPQNSILFSGTIKENITYGLKKYTHEQLDKALEMANVKEFLPELPNGIDTNIGEHGGKLSGGQKQRITIARALIRDPKILILDEATSALDNISELHVQKAISASISGRTTFIVAHRLSTIRDADRIVVMENGECVECGTFEELMAKKGKFYELKNLNEINIKSAEQQLS